MARQEIRIVNPEKRILEALKKMAKDEKRGIGKQGEALIEYALEFKGYLKRQK